MAFKYEDPVFESTITTGTGAITLAGALTGFRTFASAMGAGDKCYYSIFAVDASGNRTGDYEQGIGTFNTTLARTTVLRSSNSNALVSFAAGTKLVSITALADKTLQIDDEFKWYTPMLTNSVLAPTRPPAGQVAWYSQLFGGKQLATIYAPYDRPRRIESRISEKKLALYLPGAAAVQGANLGIGWSTTTVGTVSHPTPSSSAPARVNQMSRTRWANVVTTTNQTLGLHTLTANKKFWGGNATDLGGWFFHCRFIIGLWPAATVRLFVGMSDQNTSPVASDTLAGNLCGLWHATTDAASVLKFVTRDGSTLNSTNISLAANLAAGQAYDFWMYRTQNGGTIYYRLVELATETLLTDSNTATNVPTSTAFMGPTAQMSNGTANTTVTTTAIEVASCSVEADH